MNLSETAARLAALTHADATAQAGELVATDPATAAALLSWLAGQHAIDTEKVEYEGRRATEAVFEASRNRLLWTSAAACLARNRAKLAKPRGGDERRMLAHIDTAHGPIAAGTTDGWLDWLPDVDGTVRPIGRNRKPGTPQNGQVLALFAAGPDDTEENREPAPPEPGKPWTGLGDAVRRSRGGPPKPTIGGYA